MAIHRIKIHPRYVDRLLSGQKTFEIRKNDRDYQVGDRLSMYPWEWAEDHKGIEWANPLREQRNVKAEIIYFTTEYQQEGYCVLGIRLINTPAPTEKE